MTSPVWKPTSITVHFDNTCGPVAGQRKAGPQMFCFSQAADWFASDMQSFETRKQVTTEEELIEAVRLLRDTEGSA